MPARRQRPRVVPRRKAHREPKPAKRAAKKRRRKTEPKQPVLDLAIPDDESVPQSMLQIAQDAVRILRRELAWKARMAEVAPGLMNMSDVVALLKLMTELGEAAKRGAEDGPAANYDRLTAAEREQLATLLLKVDYT